jgi:putative ABC transport system permease protein
VALGAGANVAVFRVIYGVLIQPLPFRDPSRLVQIWETHPAFRQLQAAIPDFKDWQAQSHSFDQMAAHTLAAMDHITLLGEGEPETLHGANATYDLFSTMGIEPMLGRGFTAQEDRTQARVAVISEKLWRRKFGADPKIIGRQIRLEPLSFTVIGVVSDRQCFPQWADLWIPFSFIEDQLMNRRKYHPLEVIARLRPGVSEQHAQAEMQSIAQRLAQLHPDTNGSESAQVIPLVTEVTGAVRPSLLLVWAAVGLVLLIACANLAHLLLARMLERREELAIRSALGASQGHLIRQILTESLMLAGTGGAVGVIAAVWTGELLRKLAQDQIPRMQETGFTGPVWLFAVGISILCGVLFALPACWRLLRDRRVSGRSVIRARSHFGSALMAGEVALAFVVLAGAALLLRSFAVLLDENPGFDARGVVAIDVSIPYGVDKAAPLFRTQVLPALSALPGVEKVAAANTAPMSLLPTEHSRWATRFGIEGRAFESGQYPVAQVRYVTPQYFGVLAIPLKSGQWLTAADDGKPRCLINETLAKRFFGGQDPLGKRLVLGVVDPKQTAVEIAGVVGDVRDFSLDEEPAPTFYTIDAGSGTLLVKTAGTAAQLEREIRETVHRIDAEIVVRQERPLEQNIADSLAQRRFALTLLAAFAGLAAVLTAAGIYGLMAYSVSARIREFGVRAAVGATPANLVRMILRETAAVAMPGLTAGLVLALAFARFMKSVVYRVSLFDPWSIASAGIFLMLIALLSAWLPARRAARVDAAAALRSD